MKISMGWHTIAGYSVYVNQDGMIVRGIGGEGLKQHTVYPYRWDRKLRCWSNCWVAPATFRLGVRRGTWTMM